MQHLFEQMATAMFPQLPKSEPKTDEELEREAVGNYVAAIAKANTELMMFYFQKVTKS